MRTIVLILAFCCVCTSTVQAQQAAPLTAVQTQQPSVRAQPQAAQTAVQPQQTPVQPQRAPQTAVQTRQPPVQAQQRPPPDQNSILGDTPPAENGAPPVPGDQQMFARGTAYYDGRDYVHAYQVFYWLAEHDDVAAMRNVGLMKRYGRGTPRDPRGALDYLKQAAEAGLPTAQADLGEMYLFGETGPPDPQSALPWLEAAAKAHHPIAEFRLAEIYERGSVVKRDVARAEAFYAEAASAGVPQAANRLALLKSGAVSAPRP